MASRSLGTLTVDLIAKTGQFEKGLDKAARDAETRFQRIQKSAVFAGKAIGTAIGAALVTLPALLKSSIDRMDELSKASQRANLPTEQFTALAYAGGLADVQIETLQTTMGRLAKAQADSLKSTSQQGKVFDALGIAVQDAEGNLRSSYDVFLDFADAFERQRGSPEIVAAGMAIFGKSFQNIIPLIKDGASGLRDAADEAKDFGYIISTDAGQAAEAFNDNLARITSLVGGLANAVAAELLPDLQSLTDEWVRSAREGDKLTSTASEIADAIRAVVNWMREGSAIGASFRETLSQVSTMAAAARENLAGIFSMDKARIDQSRKDFAEAGKAAWNAAINGVDEARSQRPLIPIIEGSDLLAQDQARVAEMRANAAEAERLRRLAFGDPEKTGGGGSAKKTDAEREAEQVASAYQSLIDSMNERIALFNTEGEAAKINYDIQNSSLKILTQGEKDLLVLRAETIDMMEKQREEDEQRLRMAEEETELINRGLEQGKLLLEDMQLEVDLMRMSNKDRREAIALWGLSEEAVERYGDSIKDLVNEQAALQEQIDIADGFRDSFSSAFEEVINGTMSVKDAFKSMLQDINDMVTRMVSRQLMEQLFGEMGTSNSGQAGGWIQQFASLFAGGRANGGWISPNSIAEVNERGMEMATIRGRDYLMTGDSPVRITPNHQLQTSGGKSQNITQNFYTPASRQSAAQLQNEAALKLRMASNRA